DAILQLAYRQIRLVDHVPYPFAKMTRSVTPSHTPEPPEPFVQELTSLLLPIEGSASFRHGSRPAAVALVLYRRGRDWHVPFVAQASELDAVLEVPLSLLLDPGAWQETPEAWPGRHLPVEGAVIWGLTARILSDLLPAIAEAARTVSAPGAGGARGPGSPPA